MNEKLDKKQRLYDLQAKVLSDKVCPELEQQATQLVFGDGNPNADIVVIGEAPGKNEDIQGKPFVGAAGKFLNEMLDSINLIREDIYITNIVKYRPPNNRDPLPEEKRAFWPYLVRQLDIIHPKLVVTLGRHSMEYFLPGQKISQIHGQPKRIKLHMESDEHSEKSNKTLAPQLSTDLDVAQGSSKETERNVREVHRASTVATDAVMRQDVLVPAELDSAGVNTVPLVVLPLYHPAAALYNGSMRQTLIDDFVHIPEIMKKIN